MSWTLKRLAVAMNLGLAVILAALIATWFLVDGAQGELQRRFNERYQSYLLADELRQSSDDLTRLARTYVVTGDARYEDQYLQILDIRNGKKPRPQEYHRIYWDFVASTGTKPRGDDVAVPLQELMKRAGFTDAEFAKLDLAQSKSDGLVKLEVIAMNAVKGLFDDGNGNFTVKKEPDFELARKLVHSKEYHDYKAQIMAPIDEFFVMLDKRTAGAIAAAQQHLDTYDLVFTLLLAALFAGLACNAAILLRGVVRPVNRLKSVMERLAGGDTAGEVFGTARGDEIGAMARTVQVFRDSMIAREKAEADVTRQREESEQQRAAREARERRAIEEISALCEKAVAGDLSTRIDEAGKDGFLLTISQRLNGLTAMLQQMTGEMAKITAAMAEGDLTNSIRGNYDGVFGMLKDSVNTMAAKLREIAGSLGESSRAVKEAAAEISTGSQDLASRTESQAASIEETAASMHEITATVKQNADNAAAANQLASVARDAADKGGAVMGDVVKAMERIEGSAGKISEIVGMIDEIAFQTNLLALNASVEAARAGEAGKGFAVVAQEVRALAQRSANASKDIKTLITASNGQVREGGQLVAQAGSSLTDIVGAVKKVSDIVAEITAASREQATGLEQINGTVAQMDETTQRNGALVEQTSASAQALSQQADQLSQLVSFFRTGGASSPAAYAPPPAAPRAAGPKPAAMPRPVKHGSAALKLQAAAEQDWQEF